MEIPVAAAGGAQERLPRPFLAARHEFPAAIDGVATDIRGVVLLALAVPHCASHHGRGNSTRASARSTT